MAEHALPGGLEGDGTGVNGFSPLRFRGTNGNSKEEDMAEAMRKLKEGAKQGCREGGVAGEEK